MSDAHAGTDAGHTATEHVSAAHDDGHGGHDDGHGGHDGMQLGGIAWSMWLAGLLGIAAGLAVTYAFVLATAGVG
jgi:hypothetical protein